MIPLIEQILFLQNVPIFKGLTIEELGHIASITSTEEYDEDEVLFTAGEPGETAFVIISGTVEIYHEAKHRDKVVLGILKSGDCFGEMAIFDGEPRSASAVTKEPSIISSYTKKDLTQVIKQYPSIALGIINVFSKRIRVMNDNELMFKRILKDFKVLCKKIEKVT